MGEMTNAYKILVQEPEGKRPSGRSKRRWDNITMYVRQMMRDGVDCMHLGQDRNQWLTVVNTVMNLRVPYNVENFLTS
jgi:hypothetical protein